MMARSDIVAIVVALALLGGAAAEQVMLAKPQDADAYHTFVRDAANTIPSLPSPWKMTVVEVPAPVIAVIRPNLIMGRRFTNSVTGHYVDLMLVHCTDISDLFGHYPPACYPGQGWQLAEREPADIVTSARTYRGSRYQFGRSNFDSTHRLNVLSIMLTPDGQTRRNMDELSTFGNNVFDRFYGGAHLQIVTDAAMNDGDRQKVTLQLLELYQPLLDQILRLDAASPTREKMQ